mmetsp:Transcript_59979/g.159441  ORF Transcript_59979/g.159441 Transcript_59979/m.159441 type:complete len:119 (-) Transcript_59979:123-479(-)
MGPKPYPVGGARVELRRIRAGGGMPAVFKASANGLVFVEQDAIYERAFATTNGASGAKHTNGAFNVIKKLARIGSNYKSRRLLVFALLPHDKWNRPAELLIHLSKRLSLPVHHNGAVI